MITGLEIKNFKGLRDVQAELSKITLLTGINGRGKSSFIQTLLLLSQTWRRGLFKVFLPNGCWKQLGTFFEIKNSNSGNEPLIIKIRTDDQKDNQFELKYSENNDTPEIGTLLSLSVNDNNIAVGEEEMTSDTDSVEEDVLDSEDIKILGSISDFSSLSRLKQLYFISADRIAARSSEIIDDDVAYLDPAGKNLLNFIFKLPIERQKQIEDKLSIVLDGASISLNKDNGEIKLLLNSENNKAIYRPDNVGYGFSYLLSLITALVMASSDETLIIENPEAHLHPGAQSRIMEMLIDEANSKNFQLIIETHSDHIINASLLAIKRQQCKSEDLSILFFKNIVDFKNQNDIKVQNLNITNKGRILNPPKDFCDQYSKDLRELYTSNG